MGVIAPTQSSITCLKIQDCDSICSDGEYYSVVADMHDPHSGVNGITFPYENYHILLFEDDVYSMVASSRSVACKFNDEIAIRADESGKWSIYRLVYGLPGSNNAFRNKIVAEARRLMAGE
jgi:hypothetical protein